MEFCDTFNEFYETLIAENNTMIEFHEIDIADDGGTKLALFRITGVADIGDPGDSINDCKNRGGRGDNAPVLLIPSCFEDASAWFEILGDFSFPARLCKESFDVWMINPKGA